MSLGARAVWQGGHTTLLEDDRGHQVTIDLPKDEGGTDLGTSGLELNLLSLAGCISTIFAVVAHKRRVRYAGLEVRLTADRPRGSPTLRSVDGECTVLSDDPPEAVETALAITLRTCPVGALYERARIPVHVRARISPAVRGNPQVPASAAQNA